MRGFVILCQGLWAVTAAGIATLQPVGDVVRSWEVNDKPVAIHQRTKVTVPGVADGVELPLTGTGLREKTILLFDVDVYVATSYGRWTGKDWKKSDLRVLQLHMLRDLSGEKVRSSFASTLEENNVSLEEPPVKKLLDGMKFDVTEGTVITLVGYRKKDGTQGVIYQLPGRNQQVEGPAIADQFWSIWFGKPADGGLERLKAALLGEKKK